MLFGIDLENYEFMLKNYILTITMYLFALLAIYMYFEVYQ